jgi:regulatory protein
MSGARGRTTAATGFGGARAAVGEVAAHAAAGGPDGRRSRSQQPGSTGSDATGPDSTGIDSTPLGGPVPGEAPVVRVQDPQERRRVADELRDRLDALHRSTGASRVLPAVAGTVGAAPSTGGPADASPPVDAAGTGGSRASARAVSTAGGTPADPEPRVPGAPEPNPEVRAQPDAGDGPDRAWSDDTGAPDERTTSAPRRTGLPARGGRRRAPASEPPPTGSAAADAEPDPESVARSVALRLLTGAPRSRAQLAEAMAKRDVPEEVADRVLDRFTEVGLVDDAAYAEILVRSRHQERKLSRRALAQELRRRGVDDDVAREALEQVGEDDEEQAARALARKKLAATRGLDREVRLRRAYGALGRRGYGGSLVSRVVREELAAEGQDDDSPWGDRGA